MTKYLNSLFCSILLVSTGTAAVPERDKSVVSEADRQWWAFRPLAAAVPPAGADNPIDAFLLAGARARGLTFNPPADRRTILRRIRADLTGLPPTVEETAEFTAGQPAAPADPAACAALVDRLLASPAYGERWARHWLDVARFAESSGFEHDYDRPHAFHYRDFVIRAFNDDMPFDQFTRWQLAGDEFAPDNSQAMMATGFLGAGVFPTQITANEVERTRYDAMDDMLATTSSAFLGLTVGCARCHDHKYDPIPARDYYRMLAAFTTTVRSNIDLDINPDGGNSKAAWRQRRSELADQLAAVEKSLHAQFAALPAGSAELHLESSGWNLLTPQSLLSSNANTKFVVQPDGSYLATGTADDNETYTVEWQPGADSLTAIRIETLVDPAFKGGGPGRADNGNFALGTISLASKAADGKLTPVAIARGFADHQQNAANLSVASSLDDNPSTGWAVDFGGLGKSHTAVFVLQQSLAATPGTTLQLTMKFTVNTRHSIGRPRFSTTAASDPQLDGAAADGALTAAVQVQAEGKPLSADQDALLFSWWRQRQKTWADANAQLAAHDRAEPRTMTPVMVCAEGFTPIVMHSQGAPFLKETHILKRGDPNLKEGVATPGFLQVLSHPEDEARWHWTPPAGAKYSGRRRSLANWLTDVDRGAGALLARVAVNRLWQHHFGRGLVPTTNDFGRTGTLPANPELLDFLAGELIRNGWQLKPIHRLIMASAAYRQAGNASAEKVAADPDNALFMRREPQRLEAEVIRDSVLSVAGMLDNTLYGKGTLAEASRRRSIYFTVKRSQLVNSMVVFDAPEPLTSQGERPSTTVAPQALLLMNSAQVRDWSKGFARRVQTEAASEQIPVLVERAYRLALARPPQPAELQLAIQFMEEGLAAYADKGAPAARSQALAEFCQTLFGLNEFIYVE